MPRVQRQEDGRNGTEQEMGHTSEQGGNKRSAAMCERASARVHTRTHMYALYVCLDTQAAEGLLVLRMPYMYALNVCLKCMPYMQAAEDRAEARQTSCASRFLSGARRGLTKRTEVHATMSAGCNP